MAMTTALPLAILSGIVIYQVNLQIEKDKLYAENRIKQDLRRQIEEFADSLSGTAYRIYSNPNLIESIAYGKEFLSDSRTYDTVMDIREFFLSVYNQSPVQTVLGMYLIRNDEDETLGNFFPNLYPRLDPAYLRSLHRAMGAGGQRPLMRIVEQSPYDEPIFQFLYPVKFRGNPAGLLAIDIPEQDFRDKVEIYNPFYRGQVLITDVTGTIVYATDSGRIGQTIDKRENGRHSVSISQSLSDGSLTIDYTYQIDPSQLFYRSIAYIVILVAGLLALGISLGLSFNITKPIVQMYRSMARINKGDYNARVEVRTRDEIGFLGNQFNRMAETIQQLIEHDFKLRLMNQESQIKALQAQISPHFLFNTLQMMAGIAGVNKVPDLKLICQSLSQMYRYNMNIQNEWVRLRDEVMHIRHYLVIINKRFPNSIRYRMDLQAGSLDARIPRLILQPIVENAVEHGLAPSLHPRKLLKLSARIDPDQKMLYLSVLDNGKGMESSKLKDIERLLRVDQLQKAEGTIGLYNVHARIRLICGETYGIEIKSRQGVGTQVIYRLPIEEVSTG
ncbi:sensor histidine kinase [Cohnella lubricantis]|uniref:Histidine kinase n=1 Tax=Cohnella lubricantis TaxID=2163172 RepID=A0A841TF60_9BACL|nr:sensor histidine kinase [Cohnella lubricantis]MBB6677928.1 histidine kinase [Cohnella lubricantis]MBP2120333.1 two-component system sensor histidine kinase YesM [Cohnella lubricantis]